MATLQGITELRRQTKPSPPCLHAVKLAILIMPQMGPGLPACALSEGHSKNHRIMHMELLSGPYGAMLNTLLLRPLRLLPCVPRRVGPEMGPSSFSCQPLSQY